MMLAVSQGRAIHFSIVLLAVGTTYGVLCWQEKTYVLLNGLRMLRRLRWFYLSILLIYGWMGVDQTSSHNWFSFIFVNWQGLQAGFYQITVIAVFTLTINLLLGTSSKDELIEGLYFLLFPLGWFGINVSRIVIRIVLVLEKVEEILLSLSLLKKDVQPHGSWFQRVAKMGGEAYQRVVLEANSADNREIVFDINQPLFLEWFLPISLAVFFFML